MDSGALLFVVLAALLARPPPLVHAKTYCRRGQPCWPTAADVIALSLELDPAANRSLAWHGFPEPRVSAVPIASAGQQPLYGSGIKLKPLYVQSDSDRSKQCFSGHPPFVPTFCNISVRGNPLNGWTPAFVVWPLTAAHVQAAVKFAVAHNLCIMVAGTGHDFINRHSCNQGVFIRTALMKQVEIDVGDDKGFGNAAGSVKFGPGIVFSEAQYAVAQVNRVVASGWADTVGIIGWSIGGGHGPIGPSAGLGVDNILEVDIVTANGELITANATSHPELYWALRGGGGSTWGVITAITVKMHPVPTGGFTQAIWVWEGTMCGSDLTKLHTVIDGVLDWMLGLHSSWSGLVWMTPSRSSGACDAKWEVLVDYFYLGGQDANFTATWASLKKVQSGGGGLIKMFANFWDRSNNQTLEPIVPVSYLPSTASFVGGVPSVVVDRAQVATGGVRATLKEKLLECLSENHCARQELYHDITGQLGSVQDPNVSISPGFRTGFFHWVVGPQSSAQMQSFYALGPNSYFSESAHHMNSTSWQARYWGTNYAKLLTIKAKYDPNNVFWCHHCIGSQD